MQGMWEHLSALSARIAAGEAGPAPAPAPAAAPDGSPLLSDVSSYMSPPFENPSLRALTYVTPGVARFQELFPLAVPKDVPSSSVTVPACLLCVEVRATCFTVLAALTWRARVFVRACAGGSSIGWQCSAAHVCVTLHRVLGVSVAAAGSVPGAALNIMPH
jgi:hypothetical protein